MSASSPMTPTLDLGGLFNGLYYGFVISTVLFGVTSVQAWIYVRKNDDSWRLRSLVALLVALDFITTFLNSQTVYDFLVPGFGNVAALTIIPNLLKVEILISFLVIYIVDLFFAYRVFLLRRLHRYVAVIVAATATAALVMGLVSSVHVFNTQSLAKLHTPLHYMIISLALSLVADILSTIAISLSLHKSRTGFNRSDTLLQKFFHFIVGRGLLLALDQIATLIVLAVRNDLNWIPSHFILTRLYVITIVAMLNSRPGLKDDVGAVLTERETVAFDAEQPSSFVLDDRRSNGTAESTPPIVVTMSGQTANALYMHYPRPMDEKTGPGFENLNSQTSFQPQR